MQVWIIALSLFHTIKKNIMTTIESIQMNIHTCKTELRLGQKVICKNEIEKLHNQGLQEYFQIQLQELESCLKLAIKQKS